MQRRDVIALSQVAWGTCPDQLWTLAVKALNVTTPNIAIPQQGVQSVYNPTPTY